METDIKVNITQEQPIKVAIMSDIPINVTLDGRVGMKGDSLSVPPQGYYPVKNIYVNSAGKLIVEYDDGR